MSNNVRQSVDSPYIRTGDNGQSRVMIPMGGTTKDFNTNYKFHNYNIINNRVRICDGNIIRDRDVIPVEHEDETYKRKQYAIDIEYVISVGCILDKHDMDILNEIQLAFHYKQDIICDIPYLHNLITICKYDENDRLKQLENNIRVDNGNYHLLLFEIDMKSNKILTYKKKPDEILDFIKNRLYVYAY